MKKYWFNKNTYKEIYIFAYLSPRLWCDDVIPMFTIHLTVLRIRSTSYIKFSLF
jgi:hypothetical protein